MNTSKKIKIYMLIITLCLAALIVLVILKNPKSPVEPMKTVTVVNDTKETSKEPGMPITTFRAVKPHGVYPEDTSRWQRGKVTEIIDSNHVVLLQKEITTEIVSSYNEVRIIGLKGWPKDSKEGIYQSTRLSDLLYAEVKILTGERLDGEAALPVYLFFPLDDLFADWFLYYGFGYFESDGVNILFDDRLRQTEQYAMEDRMGIHGHLND